MKKINELFISFEGPEASGKSSQINLLKKYFIKNNISYLKHDETTKSLFKQVNDQIQLMDCSCKLI